MKKLIFSFATFALAVGSAASYNLTIYQPAHAGGQDLKPGEYKVELRENTAVFSRGKEKVEMPVKVETSGRKFDRTSVRYGQDSTIQQIQLRGTNTTLVFGGESAAVASKSSS